MGVVKGVPDESVDNGSLAYVLVPYEYDLSLLNILLVGCVAQLVFVFLHSFLFKISELKHYLLIIDIG